MSQRLFILEVLEYLLMHNYLIFDGVFYLQQCGASTGATFLPSLANQFMGWWEWSHIYEDGSPYRSYIHTLFH